jgi:hypothetical protein
VFFDAEFANKALHLGLLSLQLESPKHCNKIIAFDTVFSAPSLVLNIRVLQSRNDLIRFDLAFAIGGAHRRSRQSPNFLFYLRKQRARFAW